VPNSKSSQVVSFREARKFVVLLAAIVAGAFASVSALQPFQWAKIPSITIVAANADPRIPVVTEATAFWNEIFAQLGTPFRLGEVTVVNASVPDGDIQAISEQILGHSEHSSMPSSLARVPGDLLIVLSNADFVSFTARAGNRVIIAIKNGDVSPLSLPNVLPNVIAHELGHAVGLEHNDNPALLMCGRPAACRPKTFESPTPKFFPLSEAERKELLTLYPRNWTAR
jgi:hypothetical protein